MRTVRSLRLRQVGGDRLSCRQPIACNETSYSTDRSVDVRYFGQIPIGAGKIWTQQKGTR